MKVISPVNVENRKELGLKPGDTVRVWQKIQEGDKTRLQAFEGIVLSRKHGNEAGATFTVRKTTLGVGIERIFPLFSPNIDKIEIVKRAKIRRSKLYHIRDKAAKQIKRQMRNMMMVDMATESDIEEKEKTKKEAEEAEQKAQEKEKDNTNDTNEDTNDTKGEEEKEEKKEEGEKKEEVEKETKNEKKEEE